MALGILPLTVIVLVVVPFVTFYISVTLFQRKSQGKVTGKTPPTIPYYFPGIFHAFGLAYVGPQKYFAHLLKEYDGLGPFFVNAGPQPFLITRNPEHIERVMLASQPVALSAARIEVFDKLYGSPQTALDLYAGKSASKKDGDALEHAHVTVTQKHLSGVSLSTNVEKYMSILSRNLNDKMFQVGSWTQIEDAWSFLRQVVTRCSLVSLLGTDLLKQYPGVVKDYWEFADAIEGFIPGLPRYWVPGAAAQVQERLLQGIEKWLKANHSGSEFARIADEDPIWDDFRGSKFVQERDDVLARIEGMDMRARAAEILSIMHEANSTIIPCVTWSVLEIARRRQLAEQLTASISRHSLSKSATYNIRDITELGLMKSLLAETVRLRTAAIEVHKSQQDLRLSNEWTVPKDNPIITLWHDVALNTKAWGKARSRTIEQPLENFWPERFLLYDHKGSRSAPTTSQSSSSFSMDGLESLHIRAGSGHQPLLGSEYASMMHAATLAILLNEFEVQLCEDEYFDAVLPPARELSFGMLQPLDKVALRIRKQTFAGAEATRKL